jgi:hypothetical protein
MVGLFDRYASFSRTRLIPKELSQAWQSRYEEQRSNLCSHMDEKIAEILSWSSLPHSPQQYEEEEEDEEEVSDSGTTLTKALKRNTKVLRLWYNELSPEMKWFIGKLAIPLCLNYVQSLHVLLWRRREAMKQEKKFPVFPMF